MLVAIPIVSGYLLLSTDDSPINQATCEKIQLGWAFERADAILPPEVSLSVDAYDEINEVCACKWTDYLDNQIIVRFEREKGFWGRGEPKVAEKKFVPSPLSFAERLKRRIERRIRALWPKPEPPIIPLTEINALLPRQLKSI